MQVVNLESEIKKLDLFELFRQHIQDRKYYKHQYLIRDILDTYDVGPYSPGYNQLKKLLTYHLKQITSKAIKQHLIAPYNSHTYLILP